jgi:uncharacterized protein YqeY
MREEFTAAMKDAMKAGDKEKLGTVRLFLSALKDKDNENRGLGKPAASDVEILGLLQKMSKQRQDSITLYTQGARPELAAKEQMEIDVIAGFLPAQLSEHEVEAAVRAAIAETGAAGIKDMGKVIGVLKAKFAGRMDFAKASGLVKQALNG